MTWGLRFRLALGLIMIVLVVSGMTFLLNQRLAQATSIQATIVAGEYTVGTDYSGHVTELFVEPGDQVTAGAKVAEVSSPVLQSQVAEGMVNLSGSSVALKDDGQMALHATESGVISSVEVHEGSFVTSGSVVAEIEIEDSRFVTASLVLAPRDYARLVRGAQSRIILPDQSVLDGELTSFTVANDENEARVTATVYSDELAELSSPVTETGTPVTVSIDLVNDGVISAVQESVQNFMRKIGL